MTPQDVVKRLLARQNQPDFDVCFAELKPCFTQETLTYLKQAVDCEKLRNAHHALQIAEIAEQVATSLGTVEANALALWSKGNALTALTHHQEALAHYQKAEGIYTQQDDTLAVACMQVNQVATLHHLGNNPTAVTLAKKAQASLEMLGKAGERFLGILAMNVGAAYREIGDFETALTTYKKGRAIYLAQNNLIGVARTDINRAAVLQEMDQFAHAETLLLRARDTLIEGNYPQEVARANLNLGMLAYRRGQYQQALKYLELAHSGFAAIPNLRVVAVVNLYRCFIYRDLNLLHETINFAQQAEKTFRQHNLHWNLATALINQGIGYQQLGMYQQAEKQFNRARRYLKQQGVPLRVLMLDLERAYLALKQGRVETARRIGQRIERQLDQTRWPTLAARLHLLLARSALAKSLPDRPRAHQRLQQALDITQRYNLAEVAANIHYTLGQTLVAEEKGEAAWRAYQQAIEIVEGLRTHLALDEFHLNFMVDKLPIYLEAVRLSHTFAPPALIYYILNLAQNAPLPHLKQTNALTLKSDTHLQTLREAWHWYQSKLEKPDTIAEKTEQQESQLQNTPLNEVDLRQQIQALEIEIADHIRRSQIWQTNHTVTSAAPTPETFGLNLQSAKAFVTNLQHQLPPTGALLHYYVLDNHFQAILITPTEIQLITNLNPTKALKRTLRSWRFHLGHSQTQTSPTQRHQIATAHLQQFYQELIAPLRTYLANVQQLFLIVPPNWHDLPFSAFFDGEHYLVEHFDLMYLSSADVLLNQTTPPPQETSKPQALIIGYSDNGRLPNNLVEAKQIAISLKEHYQPHVYLEEEATRAHFQETNQSAQLVHLASHALFRPESPTFSWVRLADSCLTVADLTEITLPGRPLVVLSACETGRGEARGGGLLGMGRGFLGAGAMGLIVSLWKIDDEQSANFMSDFYHHLSTTHNSAGVATALSQAQCQAIDQGKHPFFWAGFIFIKG